MILLTGASGQLGALIVKRAKSAGLDVVAGSRSSDADRIIDFDRPETLDFSGVKTLFLTSAGYAEDDVVIQRHGAAIEAAKTYGVEHIIYTSLSSASDHLGFALAHRWTERAIQNSGMKWTILRNGLYAELIGMLAAPNDGKITAPFGRERLSAVARADLAEAAVAVLKDPEAHQMRVYELGGVSSFTVEEMAGKLGVQYDPMPFEQARAHLNKLPLLPFQPPMLMSISSAAAAGFLKVKSSDLTDLVPTPRDALAVATATAEQLQTA